MKTFSILFLLICITSCGHKTVSATTYDIKHLDFFGLENIEAFKWKDSEIKKLLTMDFKEGRKNPSIKTNYMIPVIIFQLKDLHPNVNKKMDVNFFNQLTKLYLKIREIDAAKIADKSVAEKIDFMRDDFYWQVENDQYLPHMTMTFDDGPFQGVDFKQEITSDSLHVEQTNFGSLSSFQVDGKTVLKAKDNNEKVIWQKSITGLMDKNLSDLRFTDNPMEYTSVATIAHLHADGERLTLYLKNDGRFLYYYHSW
ncbi:MAG: hypothetical protein PHQ74_03825 [Crocinitomicaceae bacterium]|nr:hypothetical protein [Crocinitomicaceae bacterium]